jgi:hypothetical protein
MRNCVINTEMRLFWSDHWKRKHRLEARQKPYEFLKKKMKNFDIIMYAFKHDRFHYVTEKEIFFLVPVFDVIIQWGAQQWT